METIDKNKLIAIFMDCADDATCIYTAETMYRYEHDNDEAYRLLSSMKFNYSYDWIMPVAIKIQKEYDIKCIDNPTCVEDIFNEVVRAIQFIKSNNIKPN